MSQTRELTRELPLSGREIDVEITVRGTDGGDVTVEIFKPDFSEYSEETKAEYEDSRIGAPYLWYDVMVDALEDSEYEVDLSRHRARSRNLYLDGGKVNFDYYEEARVHEVIQTILDRLDEEIILEERRRATEEEETKAAQSRVADDMLDDLQNLEHSEDTDSMG